jgi:hypothetical protein
MRLMTILLLVLLCPLLATAAPRFQVTVLNLLDLGYIDKEQTFFAGAPIDFDRDGDLDFLIFLADKKVLAGGPGHVDPESPLLLRNDDGKWVKAKKKHLKNMNTTSVQAVFVADFDGDGRSDVYAADSGSDNEPFPGAPNLLAFGFRRNQLKGRNARFPDNPFVFTNTATMADVDGDGSLDIYEANQIGGGIEVLPRVLFNDGKGNFETRAGTLPDLIPGLVTSTENENFSWVRFVDVDIDGDPDLILGGFVRDYVLRNNGGVFEVIPDAMPEQVEGTLQFEVGNFNKDAWPDLIWVRAAGDNVRMSVYLNRGDGTFKTGPKAWIPKRYRKSVSDIGVLDINNDGLSDVTAAPWDFWHVILVNKNGKRLKPIAKSKTFAGQESTTFIDSSVILKGFADFDGDGDNDIAYIDSTRSFFAYAENLEIDN